jgi:DNA (cytosine-5)-methyltransferase 1
MKPVLLDLFCGAGGAAMGYHQAGWEVVGVDVKPQPRYPFEFHQGDALEWLDRRLTWVDAIHASPPCQEFSVGSNIQKARGKTYVDLVTPTRDQLRTVGLPYVIENVHKAPIRSDLLLCGTMFMGLRVIRHRIFETTVHIPTLPHYRHPLVYSRDRRRPAAHSDMDPSRSYVTVAGESARVGDMATAMEIDWMFARELNEAVPPAYTRYIGKHLLSVLHCRHGVPGLSDPPARPPHT